MYKSNFALRVIPASDALRVSSRLTVENSTLFNNMFPYSSRPTKPLPTIAVCLPNYNNQDILQRVLESLLAQKNIPMNIYIMDNFSTDQSREQIESYSQLNPNIKFVIHRANLGSVVNVNMLLHSTFEPYTLLASSNDILINENALSTMVHFLEMNDEYDLVYGRNIRDGTYAEPPEHCFSVPGSKTRKMMGLSDYCCMDIATWLYTSSEPLWGLYRSSSLKIVPQINMYGSDHVVLSCISANGGVAGLMFPFRQVDIERRNNEKLLDFQKPSSYATNQSISKHPINQCNMIMLCRSYYYGLLEMNFVSGGQNEIAIDNSLNILFSRFYPFLLREMTALIKNKLRFPFNGAKDQDPVSAFEWAKDDLFIQEVLKPYYLRFLYSGLM